MIREIAIKTLPLFEVNYTDNCPGGKQYQFNVCVNGSKVAESERTKAHTLLLKARKRADIDSSMQLLGVPV